MRGKCGQTHCGSNCGFCDKTTVIPAFDFSEPFDKKTTQKEYPHLNDEQLNFLEKNYNEHNTVLIPR